MQLTVEDIIAATSGTVVRTGPCSQYTGVSTDSRTIKPGDVFVALHGPHFDGHAFCSEVVQKGAAAVIVDRHVFVDAPVTIVRVSHTIAALGQLATWWRKPFVIPCVGITGSNGKSTTKEMTAAILETLGPVLKTEGNFNNLIGLPLTLFRLCPEHRAMVLEMGMNAPGEIRELARIAAPKVGIITNATAAHLEKLLTVDAVAEAKGELFEVMGDRGVKIVNDEDPRLQRLATRLKGEVIRFGMQNSSDIRFCHMEMNDLDSMALTISAFGREVTFSLPLPGTHNVMNAMAAMAAGLALGIDLSVAAVRLEAFRPMAMRFERIQLANGVRVVNDSYNANPASMKAAFRTVGAALRKGSFIAVLGDMLELGADAAMLHEEVGQAAVKLGVAHLFVVGVHARDVVRGALSAGISPDLAHVYDNVEDLTRALLGVMASGDVVLVKGSRGMKMERVVEYLKRRIGSG
ncbi:MAG: UDP-N-acetylmuramoyl-tripeptide--D-alanyl-D-alanine ligase [Deltaproteobacteria bacterium]|nr:UDP-N-acetylmuramoyl-tripeptide--D-alanyl-D-alanine ligase [Deltaproteobacteria bacterium]